jgi:hypothetical protein
MKMKINKYFGIFAATALVVSMGFFTSCAGEEPAGTGTITITGLTNPILGATENPSGIHEAPNQRNHVRALITGVVDGNAITLHGTTSINATGVGTGGIQVLGQRATLNLFEVVPPTSPTASDLASLRPTFRAFTGNIIDATIEVFAGHNAGAANVSLGTVTANVNGGNVTISAADLSTTTP